jgi:general secretion pathway protein D
MKLKFLSTIILILLCANCSSIKLAKKAEESFRDKKWDAAVAYYSQLCKKYPGDLQCLKKYQFAKIQAAHDHLERAEILSKNEYFQDALIEMEIAADLFPTDPVIQDKLAKIRNEIFKNKDEKTKDNKESTSSIILTQMSEPQLNLAGNEPIDMIFENIPLKTVMQTLAKVSSINIILDPDVENKNISINLKKIQFLDALDVISNITNCAYKILNPTTLIIYPNTEDKREYYQDEYAKIFFISHADVEDLARILRTSIGIKYVSADKNLNIIVIKDSLQRIRAAEKIIKIYDKPKPEVIIEVEIVELNKNKMNEYGLQIASKGNQGIQTSLVPDQEIRLDPAPILSRSHFVLVNLPTLTFRLIKTSSDARLIASLPLRTIQGQTGRVRFGQEVPVPQTTFAPIAQGGVNQQPITSFIYRNIGINIDITPHVHLNNEVTLDVIIESSSVAGQGYGGVPIFGTSRVEKSIRLKVNETSIIAGLQKEEIRSVMEGIPGISQIPTIGKLFARNSKSKDEVEIVLALTPHILNAVEPSSDDLQSIKVEKELQDYAPALNKKLPIPNEDKQYE